jgi:heme-degrading monooxygenase HmoA
MIAVIFEVIPNEKKMDEYLEIAGELKNNLQEIDGFISIERFYSLAEEGKLLSLSFWRDEKAVKQWRTLEVHRAAQTKGRDSIFKYYRLRVADVCRDYTLTQRQQAPDDSQQHHL